MLTILRTSLSLLKFKLEIRSSRSLRLDHFFCSQKYFLRISNFCCTVKELHSLFSFQGMKAHRKGVRSTSPMLAKLDFGESKMVNANDTADLRLSLIKLVISAYIKALYSLHYPSNYSQRHPNWLKKLLSFSLFWRFFAWKLMSYWDSGYFSRALRLPVALGHIEALQFNPFFYPIKQGES